MHYTPRAADALFLLHRVLDVTAQLRGMPPFTDVDNALQVQILDQAARFAADCFAPLQRIGDEAGCRLHDGQVHTPPGFPQAYRAFVDAGWPSLCAAPEHGGQGLPAVLGAIVYEWLSGANHALTMAPGLLHGAYECLRHHGDEALKARYLPRIATGEWLATMCLTEAQAGSDLGRIRTRATPTGDGSLAINGQKIFISGGDHDLSENIVHLVLCRLPDAPPGSRGLSLALVPKLLPNGARNAVHCDRLEQKMGLHGSPTCALRFDDAQGWLVGDAHQGLRAMFVMMNAARLHVALQGLGLLDAAWQRADAYARERRQMRAPGPVPPSRESEDADLLAEHPAVQRLLGMQRAWLDGARLIAYRTALQLDRAAHAPRPEDRLRAQRWCALVTPVLKAACTRQAFEGASDCLQVFGGHGYVRESGVEQIVRDARVTMLYEGTNEIQAIDLLDRQVLPDRGAALAAVLLELRDELEAAREIDADVQRRLAQLRYLTTQLSMACAAQPRLAHEVADEFLRLVMLALMAWAWARIGHAAQDDPRWQQPAAAFRRHVLPEFDLRLGMIKRECEAAMLPVAPG